MALWTLLKACLLLVNALAILNEDRFLKKVGLHGSVDSMLSSDGQMGIRAQIVSLLSAVRWLRVPLIPVNFGVVALELLIG